MMYCEHAIVQRVVSLFFQLNFIQLYTISVPNFFKIVEIMCNNNSFISTTVNNCKNSQDCNYKYINKQYSTYSSGTPKITKKLN